MSAYDVAVIGLGAMGSAAAWHLARRGARVLGLDRFSPPHALGSSHGETRIIREAYFEGPHYVPLVQRAYALWRDLERESGEHLMLETGGLMIGPEEGELVRGALESARVHDLPHQRIAAREVRERFPALQPSDDLCAVWEPRAGMLFPEACIGAHLRLAAQAGAELRTDEPVLEWKADGSGFVLHTSRGRHRAGALVLAANAWLDRLVPDLSLPVTVARQVLFWFEPRTPETFEPSRLPIYIWEPERDAFFYGFPAMGGRVKVAPHGGGVRCDPDSVDRVVSGDEVEAMRARLAACMPEANGTCVEARVCMYANTPDGHFILDRHPAHERVIVISACSGHGFKFSSAIGEVAADLLLEGGTPLDLGLFRLRVSG